jgi:hypothetical protein
LKKCISASRKKLNRKRDSAMAAMIGLMLSRMPFRMRRGFEAEGAGVLAITGANRKRFTIVPEVRAWRF